jgi:hypothetical protein
MPGWFRQREITLKTWPKLMVTEMDGSREEETINFKMKAL